MTVPWLGKAVGPLTVGPGFILSVLTGIWKPLLWRNTLLSLDSSGRGLVLTQHNMADFVDSPWEALPFLRSRWGVGWGEGAREKKTDRKQIVVDM